ncbi:MAG: hypothetical protein ACO39C_08980 [Chthoniobacterales bacterium]
MPRLPVEWRFLRTAWIHACVLTGDDEAATGLVESTLDTVAARRDPMSARRCRRLFFANLYRAGIDLPRLDGCAGGFSAFHHLEEPGRTALVLLYLRAGPPDEIADVVGRHERELPDILASARSALEKSLPVAP